MDQPIHPPCSHCKNQPATVRPGSSRRGLCRRCQGTVDARKEYKQRNTPPGQRTCSSCARTKTLSPVFFRQRRGGYHKTCIACYYRNNPDIQRPVSEGASAAIAASVASLVSAGPGAASSAEPLLDPALSATLGVQIRQPWENQIRACREQMESIISRNGCPGACPAGYQDTLPSSLKRALAILDSGSPWADMATLGPAGELIHVSGFPRTPSVLHITEAELQRVSQQGTSLPPVPVLFIPGDSANAETLELDFNHFLRNLDVCYASSGAATEYQNYMHPTDDSHCQYSPTVSVSVAECVQRVQDRRLAGLTTTGYVDGKPPRSYLNWSSNAFHLQNQEPAFLQHLKMTLLQTLVDQTQAAAASGPGKTHMITPRLVDAESCLRFLLLGEALTFTSPHMDLLGGTWVRCITGLKGWIVYTGPWDAATKDAFAEHGGNFVMDPEHWKMILLRPGDTLVMRSGFAIPHAVLTMEDSFMVGGMDWEPRRLPALLDTLYYLFTNNAVVTNEMVPRQMPEILGALVSLVARDGSLAGCQFSQADVRAVEKFITDIKALELLHCTCADTGNVLRAEARGCRASCPCRTRGDLDAVANQGCTLWCHPLDWPLPKADCFDPPS